MPLFRRSRWRDPERSCGRVIVNSLLTRKKAWYAEGPALRKYQNDIEVIVHDVFRSIGLDRPEVYFRLYMIGSATRSSEPTIMVCCMNNTVRSRVKDELRGSPALQAFPEFQIHGIPHPLEQRTPAQALARTSSPGIPSESSDTDPLNNNDVYSQSASLRIGRSLLRCRHAGELEYWATGGVFLLVNGNHYQLTSEHECDNLSMEGKITSHLNLDPDALSVNGSDDEDYGQFDNEETLQADFDILSQESITPTSRFSRSSISLAQSADSYWDEEIPGTELILSHGNRNPRPMNADTVSTLDRLRVPLHSDHAAQSQNILDGPTYQQPPSRVGSIAFRSSKGSRHELDYVLVSTPPPTVSDFSNRVIVPYGNGYRCVNVCDVASAGLETKEVFLIGDANVVRKGFLVPGTTMFQNPNFNTVQRLQIVQLYEGEFAQGDSGTAVIDQQSGDFYGHVIRGCPGSETGYIVPATETFHDLSSMGLFPRLKFEDISLQDHDRGNSRQQVLAHGFKARVTMRNASTQTEWRLPPTPPESDMGDNPVHITQPPSDFVMLMEELAQVDNDEDDIWASFVDPYEERASHKINFLRDFCRGATIENLSQINSLSLNIWLDERGHGGQNTSPRPMVLSADHLLRVLKLKRSSTGVHDVDNERCLIYITDFDRWAALVLAATSFRTERSALSDGIFRHLTFQAHIDFASDHTSSGSFCLQFHLPFFAWRKHNDIRHDPRESGVMTPLRQFIEVSSPSSWSQDRVSDADIGVLYQAHVSCIVLGDGGTNWKVFSFADAFFDHESSCDALAEYASEDQEDFLLDPVTLGRSACNPLKRDPRFYFLRVLSGRLQSVHGEWESIRLHLQGQSPQLALNKEKLASSRTGDSAADLDWPRRTSSILTQLLSTLSATLDNVFDILQEDSNGPEKNMRRAEGSSPLSKRVT
ncbi:hypothetical protein CSIM01_09492 [Colletotrichum simmondsii]|uniref:Uncharacterized protein n=1 Tax=Colletotrichum simmondsii TaxID=703756 RepID=A0A135S7W1_9PEZI|nr:hypothetical protein CSIM01_09492 [Colletotrichum simmondsii]